MSFFFYQEKAGIRYMGVAGVQACALPIGDDPGVQASREGPRRYAVPAINRALASIEGTTVVHLCFGYAAMVDRKPTGYSFLPELSGAAAEQISIEAAQDRKSVV